MKKGYIYIMSNNSLTLYIGVTANLIKRVYEHKQGIGAVFPRKYKLHKLVYYEVLDSINDAIVREKQLKNWHREWKLNLIRTLNPDFFDLYLSLRC